MTYKEELKVMSNEELLDTLLFTYDHPTDYIKANRVYIPKLRLTKTELLSRLNHNPMDEDCEKCAW